MMRRKLPGPHFYRDPNTGSLYIDGYRYMGRVRMPSMPPRIAMTDRVTGTVYVLSHSGQPGSLTFQLVAKNPRWYDVALYGPHDGPYAGECRLYIADGELAAEYAPGYNNSLILTRNGFDTTVLKIKADTNCDVTMAEYEL